MNTVWIKQGVKGRLSQHTRKAFGHVAKLYFSHNLDFFVTSLMEGNHSPGSFHYDGKAFDFKRQGMLKEFIKNAVGKGFDVVEYDDERDIFHVEYDPK